jgi:hypothetical protein
MRATRHEASTEDDMCGTGVIGQYSPRAGDAEKTL